MSLSKYILILLFFFVLFTDTTFCQGQSSCADKFKLITQAYNRGDWSNAKNASIDFLNANKNKDEIHLRSNALKYSDDCKDNIPQVYSYLIESYLRLYNLDSAKIYYFEALQNEYKINIDTVDEKIFQGLGTMKKHSASLYLGIIADYREHQLGVRYGLTSQFFLDASFNHRHFHHFSNEGDGVFGKPLIQDTNTFPNYKFDIQGYEAYLEMESYVKLPIFVSQNDVNIFYVSPGVFVTYYLNSHVNSWSLTEHESGGTENFATKPYDNNKQYVLIDTFGVNMDLKRLYKDRFNYGLLMNIGSSVNLKNKWQLFFEIKLAVGKNNIYRYNDFSSFRPGVDYFFVVVGITKKFYKVRDRKN